MAADGTGSQHSNADTSTPGPKYHAPKDRRCKFCGVAFTSSSLGRHLDQFIKTKNPKAPDNIHDVDEIRRLRGGITRRQPRNSLGGRRASTLTPVGTPRPALPSARDSVPAGHTPAASSGGPRESPFAVDSIMSSFPYSQGWEQTGGFGPALRAAGGSGGDEGQSSARRPANTRSASRQVQKAQLDGRQRLDDAIDTARAAELALRELLESWRAANEHTSGSSEPFDFDPLVLDFPALTLQCLRPPPTLFSSTQYPTASSWSIQPPAIREFEGLQSFFRSEFRDWRNRSGAQQAKKESRQETEEDSKLHHHGAALELQIGEHLRSSYAAWESLPKARRDEVWLLEMARSVGRKHTDAEKLKEEKASLAQKMAHLQTQMEREKQNQQPSEFIVSPPLTVPLGPKEVSQMLEMGRAQAQAAAGLATADRNLDLTTVIGRSIERWKSVITSKKRRSTGTMCGQRRLPDSIPPVPRIPLQRVVTTPARQPLPPLASKPRERPTRTQSQRLRRMESQSQQGPSHGQEQAHNTSALGAGTMKGEPSPHGPAGGGAQSAVQSEHETQTTEETDGDGDGEGDAEGDEDDEDDGEGDAEGDADGEEDAMEDAPDGDAETDADGDEDGGMDQDDEDADGDEDVDADMEDDVSFQMMHATPAAALAQHEVRHGDILHVPRTRVHRRDVADAAFLLRHDLLKPLGAGGRAMPNFNMPLMHGGDDSMFLE